MRPESNSGEHVPFDQDPDREPMAGFFDRDQLRPLDEDASFPEDESELDQLDSLPRVVLITGASGNIGRKLRAAWADEYELVLLDKDNQNDPDIIRADLSVMDDEWLTHFHGVDAVVHLAANPNEFSPWDELIGPNLDTQANVFNAAALAGVERIVFASSNHVMGLYEKIGTAPITVELPPRPDSPYGITKLVGERLGKSLSRAFDLTFIALRLGWIQPGRNRPETLPHEWARKMWLSNADLVHLFDCAIEAEIEDRSFVLANGMSRNHGMRWDLSVTAELLGFLPKDDAYAEPPHAPAHEASS